MLYMFCFFLSDPFSVGMSVRPYVDSQRVHWQKDEPRPLLSHVWYPTQSKATEKQYEAGPPKRPLFLFGRAIPGADPVQGKWPLVLLSHGTGGSSMQWMWLAQELAKNGYIVAAVNHHGNTAVEDAYLAQGFMLWWERATDLSVLLDRLLEDEKFASHIDPSRIYAGGFSLGGATTVVLAGGIPNPDAFDDFCSGPDKDKTCDDQHEFPGMQAAFEKVQEEPLIKKSLATISNSRKDKRIKAFFAFAPALGRYFNPPDLKNIDSPFFFVCGEEDQIAPSEHNSKYLAGILKAPFIPIKNANHYSFLAECGELGRQNLGPLCEDPPGGNRQKTHAIAFQHVLTFLEAQ